MREEGHRQYILSFVPEDGEPGAHPSIRVVVKVHLSFGREHAKVLDRAFVTARTGWQVC